MSSLYDVEILDVKMLATNHVYALPGTTQGKCFAGPAIYPLTILKERSNLLGNHRRSGG